MRCLMLVANGLPLNVMRTQRASSLARLAQLLFLSISHSQPLPKGTLMSITIPVSKTRIATVAWGIPITNEVNRLTTVTTPTAWTNVTFQNGWSNFSGYQCQYRKIGDRVFLRGRMCNGALGQTAFTLPAGFVPTQTIDLD